MSVSMMHGEMLFHSAYGTWFSAFATVQAVRTAQYKFTYLLTYLLKCFQS